MVLTPTPGGEWIGSLEFYLVLPRGKNKVPFLHGNHVLLRHLPHAVRPRPLAHARTKR